MPLTIIVKAIFCFSMYVQNLYLDVLKYNTWFLKLVCVQILNCSFFLTKLKLFVLWYCGINLILIWKILWNTLFTKIKTAWLANFLFCFIIKLRLVSIAIHDYCLETHDVVVSIPRILPIRHYYFWLTCSSKFSSVFF